VDYRRAENLMDSRASGTCYEDTVYRDFKAETLDQLANMRASVVNDVS
jgi:hypothetical protein